MLLGSQEGSSQIFTSGVCFPTLQPLCLASYNSRRSDTQSGNIRIYDGQGDGKPLEIAEKLHKSPIQLMTVWPFVIELHLQPNMLQYSDRFDTVISADQSGFVEYWQPREPFEPPKQIPGMWSMKSSTDLYEFKKVNSVTFFLAGQS